MLTNAPRFGIVGQRQTISFRIEDQGAQFGTAEITVRRETEGRLQHFLDTANDLIQSVAPDGRFLYVNRAW